MLETPPVRVGFFIVEEVMRALAFPGYVPKTRLEKQISTGREKVSVRQLRGTAGRPGDRRREGAGDQEGI